MRAGALKHKVIFQKLTKVPSETGASKSQWGDIISPQEWTQIIPLKGEEKYQSQHLKTEVNHKIRLRYRSDLDSKMRVVYGLRIFNIDSILNPFERNKELQIMATEVFDA